MGIPRKPFLITAFPRSGTKHTAVTLQMAGFEVGHECLADEGCVSWYPPAATIFASYRCVIHQTRHPLATISSATTMGRGNLLNMFRILEKEPKSTDFMYQLMWAYVQWNKRIMAATSIRFPVEGLPILWPSLMRSLGLPPETVRPEVSMRMNSRIHPEYTWDDLEAVDRKLTSQIRVLFNAFGYDRELPEYGHE